jgi:cytochrome c oxidase assembly protein subunit 11
MSTMVPQAPVNRVWWLIGLGGFAIGMMFFFLFGYSAFYSLWCKITGTQMSPNNPTAVTVAAPTGAEQRQVEVYFEAKAYDRLPVRFYPSEPRVVSTVGSDSTVIYRFKNLSDETVRFRPIHQVSPLIAGQHFSMKMCFCFKDQTIGPGESTEFPVIFSFDHGMDPRVSSVTIRYSLHRIREGEEQNAQQKRIQAQLEAAGALPGGGKTVTPGFESITVAPELAPAAAPSVAPGSGPRPATAAEPAATPAVKP